MHRDQKLTEEERERVVRQLREFIIALDLRLPHIERAGGSLSHMTQPF